MELLVGYGSIATMPFILKGDTGPEPPSPEVWMDPEPVPTPVEDPDYDEDLPQPPPDSGFRRLYVTYVKYGSDGKVYSGRASGLIRSDLPSYKLEAAARVIVWARDAAHRATGNLPNTSTASLDKYSFNYAAIRGREQQLIDKYGGAQSDKWNYPPNGGTSLNKIRGVGYFNKAGSFYHTEAVREFKQELNKFTGFKGNLYNFMK